MNTKKLLSTYGLKWNPFDQTPVEGLVTTPEIENFCWRIENLVMDGGFAMITGSVGMGKSTALRLLNHRLSGLNEVQVAQVERPQSSLADFYRELGDKFAQQYSVSNRYSCFKQLRDKWRAHIESTLFRPVVLVDEAQEMQPFVLSELRLMSSTQLDSRPLITIILCGDDRLPEKFKHWMTTGFLLTRYSISFSRLKNDSVNTIGFPVGAALGRERPFRASGCPGIHAADTRSRRHGPDEVRIHPGFA